jgi:formate dehydrogenase subunit gamma
MRRDSMRAWVLGLLLLAACGLSAAAHAVDQPFVPNPPTLQQGQQEAGAEKAQPLNNAPTWRDVRSGETFITQVKGVDTGILVQSGGETWRTIQTQYISPYGGLLVGGVVAAFLLLYLWRGPMRLHGPRTGRKIQRFTAWERGLHWTVATLWLTLACTALIMLFGKHVVIPIFGYTAFSWIASIAKNLHNFVGPLFFVSAILIFLTFVRRNFFDSSDWPWLRDFPKAVLGKAQGDPPAAFFNAAEKIVFWVGLGVLALVASVSGLILNFPNFDQGRAVMQTAQVVHAVSGVIFIALMLSHIYMGTIGTEGSLEGMRDGAVDEQWAKEHHSLWYDEVVRERRLGEAAAGGSLPAGAPAQRL